MRTESANVDRKIQSGATVAMLIAELENMPPDAQVLFVCDYGDYHHTQQAMPVSSVEETELKNVVTSAYSQSGLALNDDDGDEDEIDPADLASLTASERVKYDEEIERGAQPVVILRM